MSANGMGAYKCCVGLKNCRHGTRSLLHDAAWPSSLRHPLPSLPSSTQINQKISKTTHLKEMNVEIEKLKLMLNATREKNGGRVTGANELDAAQHLWETWSWRGNQAIQGATIYKQAHQVGVWPGVSIHPWRHGPHACQHSPYAQRSPPHRRVHPHRPV